MARYARVLYDMVRYGMVWYGMVWHSMVRQIVRYWAKRGVVSYLVSVAVALVPVARGSLPIGVAVVQVGR